MNDILTDGNNLNPGIDDAGKVTLRSIDSDKVIDFSNDLINNYKADPKDVAELSYKTLTICVERGQNYLH